MQNRKLSGTNLSRTEIKSSPQPRRCCFERKDGTQCKAHPQTGKQYCFFHNTDPAVHIGEKGRANKAGGIASRSKRPVPSKPLKTVSDMVELMSESIHQLRRGQIDPESCATIGLLSGVLLKAIGAMGEDPLGASSFDPWSTSVSDQAPPPVPHALLLPYAEDAAEYAAEGEPPDDKV